MSPKHSTGWTIRRLSADRLFPRVLPGRHLDLAAWDLLLGDDAA